MMDGGTLPERRWCTWSRRHCFLFLLLATILFFCNTNPNPMNPDWSHKWWKMYSGTKWWLSFKRPTQNKIPPTTSNVSVTAAVSTFQTGSSQFKIKRGPPTYSQTKMGSMATMTSLITAATPLGSEDVSLETLQTTESKPSTMRPYVSPGLYFVEYPYEYHFIIDEPEKCKQKKPFLVLVVPVAPHNKKSRDIIRSTWGGESLVLGKTVTLFFLLGLHSGRGAEEIQQQLLQESKVHQDLIQGDFMDCYKNLTIKTMMMMEWLDSRCRTASFAMKIDSDMFLNVHNLINMLLGVPKTNYMTGLVAHQGAVLRDKQSKWYLPENVFPEAQYPPYALGLGYVVSLDLPKKLVEASRHIKAVYIEDVYLGLCMRHMGIMLTDPPDWNYFHIFPVQYNRCRFSRIIATTTHATTDHMWVWKDFKRPGPYC
ncbi:beta-1,3-galactosyltransferase 2-like isoform X2 [Thalassophryne amazonica]|nr:beta-1,3-galactosyltransferase 2-like isoform X2 [Thalassophryne amazonica]